MEQIYTIPVNEAFDAVVSDPSCGCPLCRLYRKLQADELDIILGASMMEPDIRIKTNELGFCSDHYGMMLKRKRMLGMGLILESHLAEVKKKISARSLLGDVSRASVTAAGELNRSCYVCSRIEKNLSAMTATVVYLYESDPAFRKKLAAIPYLCLPHYERITAYAAKKMNKRDFRALFDTLQKIEETYMGTLSEDVSWFCKKFDYRYDEEPWYNAKDAVPRAVKFLSGAMADED